MSKKTITVSLGLKDSVMLINFLLDFYEKYGPWEAGKKKTELVSTTCLTAVAAKERRRRWKYPELGMAVRAAKILEAVRKGTL